MKKMIMLLKALCGNCVILTPDGRLLIKGGIRKDMLKEMACKFLKYSHGIN